MQEIFKDIPGYEGYYQVSNQERVKSLDRVVPDNRTGTKKIKERILKPGINPKGYLTVVLCLDGNRKTVTLHRLVAITFLNHKPNGMGLIVDHINNIKTDNRPSNLQLITNRKNSSKDKWRGNYSSKYVGVHWSNTIKKWVAKIRINKKLKLLGNFTSELEAHEAYQYYLKYGRRIQDSE